MIQTLLIFQMISLIVTENPRSYFVAESLLIAYDPVELFCVPLSLRTLTFFEGQRPLTFVECPSLHMDLSHG